MERQNKKNSRSTLCGVPQCRNYRTAAITMHHIPKNVLGTKSLLKKWRIALRMGKDFPKYFQICSAHFKNSEMLRPIKRDNKPTRVHLVKGAFPTENLPQSSVHKLKITNPERAKRLEERKNKISNTTNNNLQLDTEQENCTTPTTEQECHSVGVQRGEITVRDIGCQVNLNKSKMDYLWDTDAKVNTMTGIPSLEILEAMLRSCNILRPDEASLMSLKYKILLTMYKLKSGASFAETAIIFGITSKTTKTYFADCIQLLAKIMKILIYWPTPEENQKNMPQCFQKFNNVVTVLDCTEIQTSLVHCLIGSTSTYSDYKGIQTVKFLLGVAPSGLINFMSPVVASDKSIFNLSDLLSKLKPGDAVMVDKGFMNEEELSNAGIEMIRPMSHHSLLKEHVQRNSAIASARVHVKGRIARLKTFKVLSEKISPSLLPYIDDIVCVICGLSNMTQRILKDDKC